MPVFFVRKKRQTPCILNCRCLRLAFALFLCCLLFSLWKTFTDSELNLLASTWKSKPEKTDVNVDKNREPDAWERQLQLRKSWNALSEKAATFIKFALVTTITENDRRIYVKTLHEFDTIWRLKLGRSYHMYCGTLLGAVRHQSFIPYDDDIDLIADRRDQTSIEAAFHNTALVVRKDGKNKCKIFLRDGRLNKTRKGWSWPYIDLYFYNFLGDGWIRDVEVPYYHLRESTVFPTTLLPFEGFHFPAPKCYYLALEVTFGKKFMNTCCPPFWNHRTERYGPNPAGQCISCTEVFEFFNISLKPLPRESDRDCLDMVVV